MPSSAPRSGIYRNGMAEEFPPDCTADLLQHSPELTPEEASGKLTPHPPKGKPTGRPHRPATSGSTESLPEELPEIQEARHSPPPPEVEESIEATDLAAARANEKLAVPPEELERAKSVAAVAHDGAEATSALDAGPVEEDEELNTAGKLSPHPPEGEPSKRPNPQLKRARRSLQQQALQVFAPFADGPAEVSDAEDPGYEADAGLVHPAAKMSPPLERERSDSSSKQTQQRSGSRTPRPQEQSPRAAKTRQDDHLPKIIDPRLPNLVDVTCAAKSVARSRWR